MTSIVFVDVRRLAAHADGPTVVRLAMAVNDLNGANTYLRLARSSDVPSSVAIGLAMYAVRLQIAHLAEAVTLITDVDESRVLRSLQSRLPSDATAARAALQPVLKGGTEHDAFVERFKQVRDKITFHCDRVPVKRALHSLSAGARSPFCKVTVGTDLHSSRFDVADAVLDRLVFEGLWGVPREPTDDLQMRVDEVVDWCCTYTRAFATWAAALCGVFFAENCAAR